MNELYLELFDKIDFKRIIDHPNILIAAAFWDDDRYQAARMCYKYMRAIDDLIDCHKSVHSVIAENEKESFITSVNTWVEHIKKPGSHDENNELLQTIRRFHIPLWPLETFAHSMIYDVHNTGFATMNDFLEYSQGASVSPASIFVHLNGLRTHRNGYDLPAFDVRAAATPCALFSYIVHIIRDFQKDQLNHLNYFADDMIKLNGMTTGYLSDVAHGNAGVNDGFRKMMKDYYDLADVYRKKTFDVIKEITPLLEPRYRLSLKIVFSLYLMVFERIDVENGTFRTAELNPTPAEIRDRVHKTILECEKE